MGSRTGDDFKEACHFVHKLFGRAHNIEVLSAYIDLRAQEEFCCSNAMIVSEVTLILLCDDNRLLECLVKSIKIENELVSSNRG